MHVLDAARAICAVLEAPDRTGGQVYNIGSTAQNYTKGAIVAMVSTQLPAAVIEYKATATDLRDYRVSFAKLERELNFVPEKTIPAAIADVVHALRSGIISQPDDSIYRN